MGKNFLWIIDTGSAVTYMNPNAYDAAFGQMPKAKLKDLQTDIFIKRKKFTHTVLIADETRENILGIDFLQKFQLHINPKTKEITFQSQPSRALFAQQNFKIPPFTTTLIQAKTFQTVSKSIQYIANIGTPKQPFISGLSP